jgi:hypothetical protein
VQKSSSRGHCAHFGQVGLSYLRRSPDIHAEAAEDAVQGENYPQVAQF